MRLLEAIHCGSVGSPQVRWRRLIHQNQILGACRTIHWTDVQISHLMCRCRPDCKVFVIQMVYSDMSIFSSHFIAASPLPSQLACHEVSSASVEISHSILRRVTPPRRQKQCVICVKPKTRVVGTVSTLGNHVIFEPLMF